MKKLGGISVIGTMAVLLLAAGIGILAVRVGNDYERISSYNAYIASARERAGKGINYYAKNDYISAFGIYNGDQELFQEFLEFLKATEDSSYLTYLKSYMKRYPQDTEPYSILCQMYYEEEQFRNVQTVLLEAEAAGVTSERLKEYYELTAYKFAYLSGGYENISQFYGEQALVESGGKIGLYQYGRGVVIPEEYDILSFCVNGAAAAKKDGECFFVDGNGHKSGVPDRAVDSLSILSNGFCAVSVSGNYGYMDSKLNVPEQLPYEEATAFAEGVAAVKKDGKWGIIDEKGQFILEPQFEGVLMTQFGTCVSGGVIFALQSDGYIMLGTDGERLNDYVFEEVHAFGLSGQPAAVKRDGEWTFVKNTGELFELETKFAGAKSFDNLLAPVTLDGETWGYMDGYGKIVIEPQFDDCWQFSPYGVAPVKRGDTWSMIQLLRYQR